VSTVILRNVSFGYTSPHHDVFEHLDLLIDTNWRAGLVGRNGRGKTTLLKLIARDLVPQSGEVTHALRTRYFPFRPPDPEVTVFDVVKTAVAPFTAWERRMEALLGAGDDASLAEYAEVLVRFEAHGGYSIDARITTALARLELSLLAERLFSTLSPGERTRALIASLFVGDGSYALIDEPTNHLDLAGRDLLASFLAEQRGFLLVSHDRAFLDRCIDHVVALRPRDVAVHRTNYTEFRSIEQARLDLEARRSAGLKREIRSLERASHARREGALARERDKAPHVDKGYVGHRAAKQMKRAIAIERRIERHIAERRTLLRDAEKQRTLGLTPATSRARPLIVANNFSASRSGRRIFDPVSFSVSAGDRIAILGPNGSGKSTLIEAIRGADTAGEGVLSIAGGVRIVTALQIPAWREGSLAEHLGEVGLDRVRFFHVMAALGVRGQTLEKPLETLSDGERKKIELARTLVTPADLLVWDEPLNYVDLESREQLEDLVLDAEPSLLFVEHDRYFIERVATDVLYVASA